MRRLTFLVLAVVFVSPVFAGRVDTIVSDPQRFVGRTVFVWGHVDRVFGFSVGDDEYSFALIADDTTRLAVVIPERVEKGARFVARVRIIGFNANSTEDSVGELAEVLVGAELMSLESAQNFTRWFSSALRSTNISRMLPVIAVRPS